MQTHIPAFSAPVLLSDTPLHALMLRNRVCAGFPSPAEDLGAQRIDLTQVLIPHPQATYLLRASGLSMTEDGIFDNDILVVDRAVKPRHNHIVVAVVDGDFTVSRQLNQGGITTVRELARLDLAMVRGR
jgi:DNA polymerase V